MCRGAFLTKGMSKLDVFWCFLDFFGSSEFFFFGSVPLTPSSSTLFPSLFTHTTSWPTPMTNLRSTCPRLIWVSLIRLCLRRKLSVVLLPTSPKRESMPPSFWFVGPKKNLSFFLKRFFFGFLLRQFFVVFFFFFFFFFFFPLCPLLFSSDSRARLLSSSKAKLRRRPLSSLPNVRTQRSLWSPCAPRLWCVCFSFFFSFLLKKR